MTPRDRPRNGGRHRHSLHAPLNSEPYKILTEELTKSFAKDSESKLLARLRKWFGRTSKEDSHKREIDRLDLAIPESEIYGFLGINGAGKSTTIKVLCGLIPPTEGAAYICGYDVVSQYRATAAKAMLVADDAPLFRTMTVREHLQLVGGGYGLPRNEVDRRIESLVDLFDLDTLGKQITDTFSGGETEKVALASALLTDPEVLILDEPTMALDAANTKLLREVLEDYADGGGTVLLTTHNLPFAQRICHRIGIIHDGRLEKEGSLDELRAHAGCSKNADLETVFLSITRAEKLYNGLYFTGKKGRQQAQPDGEDSEDAEAANPDPESTSGDSWEDFRGPDEAH